MKAWKACCTGLVMMAGLTPGLSAQPAAPAPFPAPPGLAPTPVPPQNTLWSFLGIGKAQRAACKEKLCASPLGQFLNNGMKPMNMFSGGIIPPCCPGLPTAADLAKPGAEGAAAAIKKEEAEAAARRAAVRYLGTVDCHYYPEAGAALVAALRGDRNECVRFEAALALGSGCCCTKLTIEALVLTASGSDRDGNPSETSERVRAQALSALEHCLSCYVERVPVTGEKPIDKPIDRPPPDGAAKAGTVGRPGEKQVREQAAELYLTSYYVQVEHKPGKEVVDNARQTLAQLGKHTSQSMVIPTGSRSVLHLLKQSTAPHVATPGKGAEVAHAQGGPAPMPQGTADNMASVEPQGQAPGQAPEIVQPAAPVAPPATPAER